jgi:prepilin-type N-terminal cleavage/methylation domain-containing protein
MIKILKIKQNRGMTLVELLISMTMLSVILAFATGLFVVQQRSSSRQQKRMQLVQRGRGTMQLLQYRLKEVRAPSTAEASRIIYTDADGVARSFFLNGNSLWMTDPTHTVALGNELLVANEVTRFTLRYNNNAGVALTAFPLSANDRGLIRQIGITLVLRSAVPMYSAYPESLTGFVSLRNM